MICFYYANIAIFNKTSLICVVSWPQTVEQGNCTIIVLHFTDMSSKTNATYFFNRNIGRYVIKNNK